MYLYKGELFLILLAVFPINIGLRVHYGIRTNRLNSKQRHYQRLALKHSSLREHICNTMHTFGPFLKKLCIERTDLYLAVQQGFTEGIKTCQKIFQNDRWNCTTKGNSKSAILGFVMARVSREASFMYAIASAGITYRVSKECYLGRIRNCGCKKIGESESSAKWNCDVDVGTGIKISRKVMEDGLLKWDAEALMNRHNSDLGRMAVRDSLSFQCKCFGLSGMCTSKTCHRALVPRIEKIGLWLKDKHKTAVHVKPSRRTSRSGYPRFLVQINGKGRPDPGSLIYLQESPTYCERDPSTGSLGTKGRSCSVKENAISNSCRLLCCGRGYDTRIQVVKRKCNCKFKWCCQVECDECRNTCKVYTCK